MNDLLRPAARDDARPEWARLAARVERLAVPDTLTPTLAGGLTIYAWRAGEHRMHIVFRPSLCVVLRGRKEARVGAQTFAYDPDRFFFTAVALPAELTLRRDPQTPLVGLVLEIDLEMVARMTLELEEALGVPATGTASDPVAFTGRLTPPLVDALDRLLVASTDPVRYRVLERAVLREVLFELLVGPEGPALRRAVHEQGKLRPLVDVMRYIEAHCTEQVPIARLARRAGMSESAFYSHFRAATGTTPLGYLKTLRLTKARALLSVGSASVTEIAMSVGYASSAQFSRDFRKTFGCTPSSIAAP